MHPLVFVLWFPIWFLILTIFNLFITPFHPYVVWTFWASQILLLVLSREQLVETFKKPEIYLALFSIFLTFGVIEFGLRFVDIPLINTLKNLDGAINQDYWFFEADHYAGFTVNSGNTEISGDEINSFDYRGLEITTPKPDNIYRIVALGGSTTWSTGVSSWQEAYPHQLEVMLRDTYTYDNVDVINGGQPGYNSWETLMNLQFRALDLDPDMIIIYQNTNDVHARLVSPELYRGDNSARRIPWNYEAQEVIENVALQTPLILLRLIVTTTGLVEIPSPDFDEYVSQPCSGQNADVECLGLAPMDVLDQNPPIYYRRNLESIIAIANQHDIDVVFMSWAYTPLLDDYASYDYYQAGFAQNNTVMNDVAREYNIPIFDLTSVMPTDTQYWHDGVHMSVEGNLLRAALLAEFLDEQELLPR